MLRVLISTQLSQKNNAALPQLSRGKAEKAPETHSIAADNDLEQDVEIAKPKSAKNLLAQKLQQASAKRGEKEEEKVAEKIKDDTQSNKDLERPIALKLAEYERKLASAKQTATQLLH